MTEKLEVKTEHEYVINLEGSDKTWSPCLRVLYRRHGTRGRFTRLLLIPSEGQTIEDLEQTAFQAAYEHAKKEK